MSKETNTLKNAFQTWKIYLAILLGIGIAAYMVYNSLQQTYFIEVEHGGTHRWVDANHNGEIDRSVAKEFVPVQNGNFKQQQFTDIVHEIDWTTGSLIWIFLAICCMAGRDIFYMKRIRTLTNEELSWRQSFRVIMIWEFASALSPGAVGGASVAMFILHKEKITLGRSTAIVIVTAMLDNLFFLTAVPLVFFFINPNELFPAGHSESIFDFHILFWLAYGMMFVMTSFLILGIFFRPKLIKNMLLTLFKLPFLRRWRNKALQTGNDILQTSNELKKEPLKFWWNAIWSTCLSWISRYLVINCLIAAFVQLNGFQQLLIFGKQFLLWIVMIVTPTPGGSGIAEFTFGKLMQGLGVSSLLLVGIAVIWRMISYFPYLFMGVVIIPKWLRKK